MLKSVQEILLKEGISRTGMIDIGECDIINQRLLPNWAKSVIMFTIPYRTFETPSNDIFSEYSKIYDYHKFSKELYQRILPVITEKTGFQFEGFCDHSPINEKLAAAKCGLGFIGRNSLFFDDIFGSFVFLGSIFTDGICTFDAHEIRTCDDCGLCIKSCPNSAIITNGIDRNKCLSAISQKKRKSNEEKTLLQKNKIAWGCDICQNVCPHNKDSQLSSIPYFYNTRTEKMNKQFILSLNEEEFQKYAFSYRGKKVVLENLENIDKI